MKRREFITLLASAVAWPLAASAQQPPRMRSIGALLVVSPDDPQNVPRFAAFAQGLQEAGWIVGGNVRLKARFGSGNPDLYRKYAIELAALAPDVMLAHGGSVVQALQAASANLPIVFVSVVDPVGGGFVASLARPRGNATGFSLIEYSIGAKWLELLKEIAPRTTRALVLRNPTNPAGIGQFGAMQSVSAAMRLDVIPADIRDSEKIDRAVASFAEQPNGGLIVTVDANADGHRKLIFQLAERYRLPAVYPLTFFALDGGLISYAPDQIHQYRQAAGYIDRILKGEKPGDLPVQAPTKFELVINLKAAKALGLDVPPTLLALADEVIE